MTKTTVLSTVKRIRNFLPVIALNDILPEINQNLTSKLQIDLGAVRKRRLSHLWEGAVCLFSRKRGGGVRGIKRKVIRGEGLLKGFFEKTTVENELNSNIPIKLA